MDIDLSMPASIDPAQHKDLLDDIQGNILKGHGREHVCLLLLKFGKNVPLAKRWVRAFGGGGWVSTASAQLRQKENWDVQKRDELAANQKGEQRPKRDSLFANLFLTYAGYQYLGIPDDHIPEDRGFRAGMINRRGDLKDSNEAWEPNFQMQPIHAMVLLAASTKFILDRDRKYVEESLQDVAMVKLQSGQALRQEPEQGQDPLEDHYVGHLNELEGISQPIFFRKDREAIAGDFENYDPSAPPNLVLIKEPSGPANGSKGYGSYLVYRKLEQNVQGIKTREQDFANGKKSLSGVAQNPLVTLALGRSALGIPLTSLPQADRPNGLNDFNYQGDPSGAICPLSAHIRKVNPRTDESRPYRIARRSITYDNDERSKPASKVAESIAALPTEGVGILFMCFQRSIENQFECLQKLANDPGGPIGGGGMDALIGQPPPKKKYPDNFLNDFVKLKGGEYFFAPSQTFFKNLR